jgi:hypothetical protein
VYTIKDIRNIQKDNSNKYLAAMADLYLYLDELRKLGYIEPPKSHQNNKKNDNRKNAAKANTGKKENKEKKKSLFKGKNTEDKDIKIPEIIERSKIPHDSAESEAKSQNKTPEPTIINCDPDDSGVQVLWNIDWDQMAMYTKHQPSFVGNDYQTEENNHENQDVENKNKERSDENIEPEKFDDKQFNDADKKENAQFSDPEVMYMQNEFDMPALGDEDESLTDGLSVESEDIADEEDEDIVDDDISSEVNSVVGPILKKAPGNYSPRYRDENASVPALATNTIKEALLAMVELPKLKAEQQSYLLVYTDDEGRRTSTKFRALDSAKVAMQTLINDKWNQLATDFDSVVYVDEHSEKYDIYKATPRNEIDEYGRRRSKAYINGMLERIDAEDHCLIYDKERQVISRWDIIDLSKSTDGDVLEEPPYVISDEDQARFFAKDKNKKKNKKRR